jgi:peptidoglycan/LPS O-acetylase OafA/YrhL
MAANPRPKIPALTGLRAVAAFWVLMLHYGEAVTSAWPQTFRRIFSSGFIGVDLFFVLSGFILSWNYLSDDRSLNVSRGEFWRARAARILPVYYATLALGLPIFLLMQFQDGVTPATIRSSIVTSMTALSLTQSWVSPFSYLWNNPGWSLSVEVFLYLSFPFVARWLVGKPLARVVRSAAILYGVTIAAAVVFTVTHPHPFVWKWETSPDFCIWVSWLGSNPAVHFHELLMGSVAFLWLREEQSGIRNEFLSGPRAVWISSVLLIVLLAWRGPMPFMAALVGAYSPLFTLLIYGLAKQQGLAAKILSTRTFVFLGEISFSLYLTHLIVWWNVEGHNREHPYIKQGSALNFFVCLAISLAISMLLYRFVEVPYRQTLKKRWAEKLARKTAGSYTTALVPEAR